MNNQVYIIGDFNIHSTILQDKKANKFGNQKMKYVSGRAGIQRKARKIRKRYAMYIKATAGKEGRSSGRVEGRLG